MIRRLTGLVLALATVAACQAPPAPVAPAGREGRADAANIAHCRQRAEEIYVTRNRDALYRADSSATPFSGANLPSSSSRNLSDRYAMDRMIADCVRNTGERSDPTAPAAATPVPAASAARPASTLAVPASRALPPPQPQR